MAKKAVVWTETAIKQRRGILKYWTIRNKSTSYAENLIAAVRDRVLFIAQNPSAGKPTIYPNTREAAMGHFSIYYQTKDSQIIITSFWDSRQDPEKLAEILKG